MGFDMCFSHEGTTDLLYAKIPLPTTVNSGRRILSLEDRNQALKLKAFQEEVK
jgi:hypothetical protein